ncbi:MAG: 16S rRNA processing protein RimM [Nitrospirae bacterium GWC2_46_6]|nr:MAG: 16S rRNA processing protein RimM [Nitrospirae bacterium GWC2_46_6]OGW21847.1 MAG: 16S rRNA processing protein RimM [Nitrospirae bacterium GWA2_46_11]OGW25177.1 MAG: 16S rRNA processing protein RimM [Nitrospirae bacterium GWB2_47_37]HAK89866.1 16S rRNA processing protein RimM [Nitrospiraceae bacterium]HCL82294.1 16S rRNA processing protein RimM [Nitrospiraceae bacterium]
MENEELITIGRVSRAHGLKGELAVMPLISDTEIFLHLGEVSVRTRGATERKKIKSVRRHKKSLLIRFENCETPEDARLYLGAEILVKKSVIPDLPEGVYYRHQIIGMKVYTGNDEYLGDVTAIIETGSNDVYAIKGADREYLIPAIRDVVKEIDVESNRMIVELMEAV